VLTIDILVRHVYSTSKVAYDGYQLQGDESIRGKELLLVDPLGHCQDAAVYFQPNLIAGACCSRYFLRVIHQLHIGRTAVSLMQSLEVYGIRNVTRPLKDVTFYVMSSADDAGNSAGNYWTCMCAHRFKHAFMFVCCSSAFPISEAQRFVFLLARRWISKH
jgi:hypothetical protein